MSKRAEALAVRVEQGARNVAVFAENLSETEWQTVCVDDSRSVAVLVHHVADAYVGLTGLMQVLASGKPIEGLTWEMVDQNSARHAAENAGVGKQEALALLQKNSAFAANAVRELSDEQLDYIAPVSLNAGAPVSTQYFIEDHPISHPYRHLASIRAVLSGTANRAG